MIKIVPINWKKIFVLSWLLFIASSFSFGQNNDIALTDTIIVNDILIKEHSPHKAAMFSALVPGMGQVYNKKYWKLPIIYGATGVFIYYFDYYNTRYIKFKNGYADMQNGLIADVEGYTDVDQVARIRDDARRNREFNVIFLAFTYMLNILDATVDAHLFDYDVSKDLSLNLRPTIIQTNTPTNSVGFSLSFQF